jgi:hypothetical protein
MPATFVPLDGRLTSLQVLNIPLGGGEVMEIVSPGTAAAGNNYQVTTAVLAAFFAAFQALNREDITSGATLATPYNVLPTDTQLLLNKSIGSPSYVVFPSAGSMAYPFGVLVKDLKGDAATNNITISFSGGQLCDGQSSIVLQNNYDWVTINPAPGGGAWFMTS